MRKTVDVPIDQTTGGPESAPRDGSGQPDQVVLAVSFVADAGKQMLESSTSVSEVIERVRRFLPAVGLEGCAVEATLSSITLSYWEPGQPVPITTMREVDISQPRLERLSGAEALLGGVERGTIDLGEAFEQLGELARSPGLRTWYARVALLGAVAGWVLFLNGLNLMTCLVALLATLLTFPVATIVERLRLPLVVGTALLAVILSAIPNLLAAAGLSLRVGPAVVGALFIYLPGRALVSAVIDGLANAPISAIARALEAGVAAGALALGMLAGSKIGAGLGLSYTPNLTATPLAVSVPAAAVGVLGLAVAWAMPRGRLLPCVAIAAGGWLVVAVMTGDRGGSRWPAYMLAAALIGFFGVLVSDRQGGSASLYTGVAILPLVPGFTLYRGALAVAQNNQAAAIFGDAALISLAIALGVAVGLAVGQNLLTARDRVAPTLAGVAARVAGAREGRRSAKERP